MDKVDEMPAGRELDALVAEKFFGWQWIRFKFEEGTAEGPEEAIQVPPNEFPGFFKEADYMKDDGKYPRCYHPRGRPSYSSDIGAAWEVVEELETTHCFYFERVSASRWACFWPFDASRNWTPDDGCFTESDPLAICRAALKTLEDDNG